MKRRGGRRAPKRVRRSPEEAEALILEAAEQLFSEKGPDAVGLKAVADRAEVSHALVTHYFGTYEALVQQVLARRIVKVRAEALATAARAPLGPESMLQVLKGLVGDPAHVRLMTWAFLSARSPSLLPFEKGDMGALVDAILARRTLELGAARAGPREQVEFIVTLTLAAGYGFALGQRAFAHAMGDGGLSQEDFFARMGELIRAYAGLPGGAPGR